MQQLNCMHTVFTQAGRGDAISINAPNHNPTLPTLARRIHGRKLGVDSGWDYAARGCHFICAYGPWWGWAGVNTRPSRRALPPPLHSHMVLWRCWCRPCSCTFGAAVIDVAAARSAARGTLAAGSTAASGANVVAAVESTATAARAAAAESTAARGALVAGSTAARGANTVAAAESRAAVACAAAAVSTAARGANAAESTAARGANTDGGCGYGKNGCEGCTCCGK